MSGDVVSPFAKLDQILRAAILYLRKMCKVNGSTPIGCAWCWQVAKRAFTVPFPYTSVAPEQNKFILIMTPALYKCKQCILNIKVHTTISVTTNRPSEIVYQQLQTAVVFNSVFCTVMPFL